MAKDGPPSPHAGRVSCLRCNEQFESPDRRRIRICPGCKQRGPAYGLRDVKAGQVNGAIRASRS